MKVNYLNIYQEEPKEYNPLVDALYSYLVLLSGGLLAMVAIIG